MSGWVVGWMDGWVGGWVDGGPQKLIKRVSLSYNSVIRNPNLFADLTKEMNL